MNHGAVDVWRIGLGRPASEMMAFYELLDPSERRRANMFRAERDRNRFVVARAAVRTILADYADVQPQSLKITVACGGKPILAGNGVSGALHFNLSHSGDVALCAVAGREVGVDLEQLQRHDDMQRVAQHFFSEIEARTVGTLSGIDRTHFFFRTWVRKEAYLKASGEGLARDTTRFTVGERGAGVTLHASDGSCRVDNSYNVYDLPDFGDHFAALALATAGPAPAIQHREWQT